ncbi:phasin family protein [Zoogloea sp.]|uniref:phasin family protein n=1 Tax=Zoogloea sp. TaxID=49181 RepID=UPI001B5AA3C8|nr:phasin family protein [Zoogloea sp.]MBK6654056.1 phasin family protein [Zoogloea sp.]MBP7444218.1 phasin family protein [Zoogloea sp.]
MNTSTEQQEVTRNTVDTFSRMSEVAFSSMERLTARNLNMARESLQQALSASMSVCRAQGDKDQDEAQTRFSGAGVERLTTYVRDVQNIVMEAQSEFAQLIGAQMSSFSHNGRTSFPGMQVLESMAQQTSDMTKANVRNMAEATNKAMEKSSQGRKAS